MWGRLSFPILPSWPYATFTSKGMLNLALKVAKAASVLRRCEKLISYVRKKEGNLKDKVENEKLTIGTMEDDLGKEVYAREL